MRLAKMTKDNQVKMRVAQFTLKYALNEVKQWQKLIKTLTKMMAELRKG